MLGRAFLAWLISDNILGFGLYPAAFGVLALSRAYGVARSAAVPRLLPARARPVPGGRAGQRLRHGRRRAVVAPIGAGRVQVRSAVAAARRLGHLPGRHGDRAAPAAARRLRPARGRARGCSAPAAPRRPTARRSLVRPAGDRRAGRQRQPARALRLPAALPRVRDQGGRPAHHGASAAASAPRARSGWSAARWPSARSWPPRSAPGCASAGPPRCRPAGLVIAAAVGRARRAAVHACSMVSLLCLVTAIASGLAKLAVDATIQERVPERVRASAFAHSETLLMLAWVAGGAIGLIPFDGRLGVAVAAGLAVLAAARAVLVAGRLRHEKLSGRSDPVNRQPANRAPSPSPSSPSRSASAPRRPLHGRPRFRGRPRRPGRPATPAPRRRRGRPRPARTSRHPASTSTGRARPIRAMDHGRPGRNPATGEPGTPDTREAARRHRGPGRVRGGPLRPAAPPSTAAQPLTCTPSGSARRQRQPVPPGSSPSPRRPAARTARCCPPAWPAAFPAGPRSAGPCSATGRSPRISGPSRATGSSPSTNWVSAAR